MIACAVFPALVVARVFNLFVAFPLVALRTRRLPTPFVSDSAPTHGTICPLWLYPSCSCPLGVAVVADASDALFPISSYSFIIHPFYTVALLEMI